MTHSHTRTQNSSTFEVGLVSPVYYEYLLKSAGQALACECIGHPRSSISMHACAIRKMASRQKASRQAAGAAGEPTDDRLTCPGRDGGARTAQRRPVRADGAAPVDRRASGRLSPGDWSGRPVAPRRAAGASGLQRGGCRSRAAPMPVRATGRTFGAATAGRVVPLLATAVASSSSARRLVVLSLAGWARRWGPLSGAPMRCSWLRAALGPAATHPHRPALTSADRHWRPLWVGQPRNSAPAQLNDRFGPRR